VSDDIEAFRLADSPAGLRIDLVPPPPEVAPSSTHPANLHLPYRIEKVLHSSHSGDLYAAEDTRDRTKVVLKEAGPHSGVAVARLRREHEMLERLAGIEGVPAVHDHLVLDDHYFLALERIDGTPLSHVVGERYPWCESAPTGRDFTEHTRWALDLHRKVATIIAEIHARGVVHGDLHLINILVRPDGGVALPDFGAASDVEERRRAEPTNHGFVAPSDRTGFDLDRYTLACLGLALFLPMTAVTRFDTGKARQLARAISEHFPVPRPFLSRAVRTIEGTGDGSEPTWSPQRRPVALAAHHEGWQQARGLLTAAIVASATPEREDRLFPSDFDELTAGGLDIAHGAAGVLYALAVTDCGRHPSFEDWLRQRALRRELLARPGFYDGLHGVAHVLDHLDHRQAALDVLDSCRRPSWNGLGIDLFGGLSGIGLNLARFSNRTGDRDLLTDAMRVADQVAERCLRIEARDEAPRHVGLMHGLSGAALLFLRLHEQTLDPALLDLAATALRRDLSHLACGHEALDRGSAGIALVLDEYLARRTDERFANASRDIRSSVRIPSHTTPGLFGGSAGILAYLSRRHRPGHAAEDPAIAARIHRLTWHTLSYQRSLAMPGQRPRLSVDLAAGAAGILLALGAALHSQPVGLPLLEPSRQAADDHETETRARGPR
jgi:hypothetical protein